MIDMDRIRNANAQGKQLADLVGVFVGGTGGIGESTAREWFQRTTRPKAYIIGRNSERGNALVHALQDINPEGEAVFMRVDISLLRNVDNACAELRRREPKIHALFLTAGYMALRGRNETIEGLDRKMVVNYYARMRWILRCMPMLTAAADEGELSRVITVLAAGSEGDVILDDLDLKHHFGLHKCLAHCVVLTDFLIEELAKRFPGTSFSHSFPGTVKSGIANELPGPARLAVKVLYAVMSPWIMDVRLSGEHHFFQLTNRCYPSAKGHNAGLPIPDGLSVMRGMDGRPGSGAYLLDWDGQTTGDEAVLKRYRAMEFGRTAWDHTLQVFQCVDERHRKRAAAIEDTDDVRPPPDPPGWRAVR